MFRKGDVKDGGVRGWAERHRTALGYVYVTLLFAGMLLLVQHNSNDQRARERRNNAEAQHQSCLQAQKGRTALRNVILVATTPQSGGVRFDLTKVPGFDALDQASQDFFRNLSVNQGTGAPPKIRPDGIPEPDPNNHLQQSLLATAPPIAC